LFAGSGQNEMNTSDQSVRLQSPICREEQGSKPVGGNHLARLVVTLLLALLVVGSVLKSKGSESGSGSMKKPAAQGAARAGS
jgi:hypothetical protein